MLKKYGVYPGGYQETAITPVEPDVLDGGDVVEGVGGGDWRRVVESVGLLGDFLSVVSRWKTKKMTSFMPPLGNFNGGWRK